MTPKKGRSSWASLVIVVLLLIALFVVRTCKRSSTSGNSSSTQTERTAAPKTTSGTPVERNGATKGLDRNPSIVNYSKHARCRMGCRHISEAEVKEILQEGKINYSKSELKGAECKKRYAVEGTTSDNQKVRIIFAPCQTEVTVVTVIDIGKEWPFDCE
jgi:hypothetical protein